ncbi:hypothetical protein [Alteromonas flava]|uniref:hypothetical protein n=1 Tax=Alteromonas flava TaxID=2048003 RepID=UPI000C291604|nr:hypothetical protein [Alteromonas flava]
MSSSEQPPQTDIFAQISEQPLFADVCNALYERELMVLAQQGPGQAALMRRKLGGLSHHVKRAAEYLVNNPTPLDVDSHNGSWRNKQASKNPAASLTAAQIEPWFSQKATIGLPVCVNVTHYDHQHLELDCVDRIQTENQTLHLNRFGWFSFDGAYVDDSSHKRLLDATELRLTLPNKRTMAAACAGHCWNHKGKLAPRTLTLRELLLSTLIDWKTFTYSGKPVYF